MTVSRSRWRRMRVALLVCLSVLAAALMVATTFGPGWLVMAIEREAQQYLQPRLRIEGLLTWQLRPKPSLALGRVALLDDRGQPQVQLESLRVVFASDGLFPTALPLESLEIRGLDLVASQNAEGRWNFTDWLVARSDSQAQTALPFSRLVIHDARARVSAPDREFELDRITIKLDAAGEQGWSDVGITARLSSPTSLELALEAEASARLSIAADAVRFDALHLALAGKMGAWLIERASASGEGIAMAPGGAWASGPMTAEVEAKSAQDTLTATITLERLAATAAALAGHGLTLDLEANRAQGRIQANLGATDLRRDAGSWAIDGLTAETAYSDARGHGSVAFSGNASGPGLPTVHAFEANIREGSASLPHPRNPADQLALSFSGALRVDPASWSASGQFAGGFDQSLFDLAWTWSPMLTAAFTAQMSIDRLNLDTYLTADGSSDATTDGFTLPKWQDWPLSAELRVGTLEFKGLLSKDARLSINAETPP